MIQMTTYFFFFYGMLEVLRFYRYVEVQTKGLNLNLLPEKEQFVLSADDVNDLKLKMVDLEKGHPYLILDIIKKACTKFRSNKSVGEALSIVTTQTEINLRNTCLLYTSDAADERSSVDLGGRRIIKKKKKIEHRG